ncbi:MAG: agmatinase family protein [Bacteroidetes bacterium]|nr:agmatinase family protein [Bacteroidota bacterium]
MTSKQDKIKNFDPNDLGDRNNNIFGLPYTTNEAEIVFLPVPWEVTVSYGGGTVNGPEAIFDASFQVDLFDPKVKDAWKIGYAMDTMPKELKTKSKNLRKKAEAFIRALEAGKVTKQQHAIQKEVNAECEKMNAYVKSKSKSFLTKNKIVGLVGGDHSTPLGLMQALSEKHKSFAILQIDAHADLRDAYEGFTYSHASIMFNALKIKNISKLVQVGIRDYCEDEVNIINNSKGRVKTYFDKDIKHAQYKGKTWNAICTDIIKQLPELIYISFDIDGLDPKLCPNTGTPVAGGFEFEQAVYLIEKLVDAGKKIISFDINEVSPSKDEWDANVGARLLYRIANLAALSNGKHN